jgi:hypothetical protein
LVMYYMGFWATAECCQHALNMLEETITRGIGGVYDQVGLVFRRYLGSSQPEITTRCTAWESEA